MLQRIQEAPGFSLVAKAPHTLHATIHFGLAGLLALFQRKYIQTRHNRIHILKSLLFFDDAEKDPLPHMLVPLDWDDVKRFFRHETPSVF